MYQSNNETRNAAPAPRVPQGGNENRNDRSAVALAAVTVIAAVAGIILITLIIG